MRFVSCAGASILLVVSMTSQLCAGGGFQAGSSPDSPITALESHQPDSAQGFQSAAPSNVTKTEHADEKDSSGISYPCEGTVNCRYKQNVRNGPWGKIIDGYLPGTKVRIIDRQGDWYRIRLGSGIAYLHASLVDIPGSPARDGVRPSPYGSPSAATQPAPSTSTPSGPSSPSSEGKTGGINGPEIPAVLLSGLEAAKKSEWFRSHKCLQFAGTIAAKAGATQGNARATAPHNAYPADTRLRGTQINELPKAVESGLLKPGMLIHVKIHYDKDPAYHVSDDAHHWFVYMGKNSNGTPMFADNTHKGNLQTADEVYSNMKGWKNSKTYGDSAYGFVPRVTAVHDPFADKR